MTTAYLGQLISKYANGTATDEEVTELMLWYRSQRIEEVEWPVAEPAETEAVRRRMVKRLMEEIAPVKAKTISFPWMRAAALLFIFAGISAVLYYINPRSPIYVTINNPSGNIRMLQLPDSSRVWLNASTKLQYAKDFTNNRKLRLSGEAYFQVKPDLAHPFTVEAGKLEATVVGTSFNMDAYAPDHLATVSVTGGMVKVTTGSEQQALLTPSMQLQLNSKTGQVTRRKIDTTTILAWKEGRLQFHGQTIADIAKRLETWYGYTIIFENPRMTRCRYYMTFKNTLTADELFSAMSEVADIRFTINHKSKTVILTGSECP